MIELVEGVDQAHDASGDQVFELDVLWESLMNAAREITHGRKMLDQKAIALRTGQCRGERTLRRRSALFRSYIVILREIRLGQRLIHHHSQGALLCFVN